MLFAEKCGEVFAQRIKPGIFDWDEEFVARGFFTSACSSPDLDPIGGLIASALVTLMLDEGFQQNGLQAVATQPVFGHLPSGNGENLRCQPFAFDPGKNKKARIVDHQLQVFLPLLFTPADEFLPVLELPGACAETDAGHEFLASKDVVTNLAA